MTTRPASALAFLQQDYILFQREHQSLRSLWEHRDLFSLDMFCTLPARGELTYVRSITNGFTSTYDLPGPGDPEHRHRVCCSPSCNASSSSGSPSSRSAFNASTFRRPACSRSACCGSTCSRSACCGSSSVWTPSLFYRHQEARHLPTLTIRAEDG